MYLFTSLRGEADILQAWDGHNLVLSPSQLFTVTCRNIDKLGELGDEVKINNSLNHVQQYRYADTSTLSMLCHLASITLATDHASQVHKL